MFLNSRAVPIRPLVGLALAIAVVLSSTSSVSATVQPYEYRGNDCLFDHMLVPARADLVREHVPAQFAMVGEQAGTVVLWVTVTSCAVSLNGGPLQHATFSDVGVMITPPLGVGGEPGADLYLLSEVTTLPQVAQINNAFGIPTGVVKDMGINVEPGDLTRSATASVPWSEGAYSIAATYPNFMHDAVDGALRWWHAGPKGVVFYNQAFIGETDYQGTGALTTDPYGRLGRLVGPSFTSTVALARSTIWLSARTV